jgi:hypothetical protein
MRRAVILATVLAMTGSASGYSGAEFLNGSRTIITGTFEQPAGRRELGAEKSDRLYHAVHI